MVYKVIGIHGYIKDFDILWNKVKIFYLVREYDLYIEYSDRALTIENNYYYFDNENNYYCSILDSNYIMKIIKSI